MSERTWDRLCGMKAELTMLRSVALGKEVCFHRKHIKKGHYTFPLISLPICLLQNDLSSYVVKDELSTWLGGYFNIFSVK